METNKSDGHRDLPQNAASHLFQEEEEGAGIQFSPPLYLQRYMLAVDYLTKHSVQTVVDLGCSECGFFRLLSTVPSLKEISLVDIDRGLLTTRTRVISPDLKDYVHRRSHPLNVFMYAGSAADYDARMKGIQAVTLIEVIEHLYPDVLEAVTHNVFGTLHPIHVIVSTPNSEFNVLFGNDDPTTFRHWDHKFEWTRGQFQAWCKSVCKSFGYEVEYTGVGFQPSIQKSSGLGPCSQAAFFRWKGVEQEGTGDGQRELDSDNVYELIAKSEFPYDDCKMSKEDRLDMEIMHVLRQIAHLKVVVGEDKSEDEDDDNDSFCIEIKHLANRSNIKRLADVQEVRDHLRQKSFDVSEDGESVTINTLQFVETSSDEEDDNVDEDEDEDKWGWRCSNDDDCDNVNPTDIASTNGLCAGAEDDEEECWDTEDTAVT